LKSAESKNSESDVEFTAQWPGSAYTNIHS